MAQQANLAPFSSNEFPIVEQGNFKEVEVKHAGITGFAQVTASNGDILEVSTVIYIGYIPLNGGTDFPIIYINAISSQTI